MVCKPIAEFEDRVLLGDCVDLMADMPSESVDLVVTDPPYLVNYRNYSDGRVYPNDDPNRPEWLMPAYGQMYRVLKNKSFCLTFCGFPKIDLFVSAWKRVGFRIEEHLVWTKPYSSSTGYVRRCHEQAFLLSKGRPPKPHVILPSVLAWCSSRSSGPRVHPAQRSPELYFPVIEAYSRPNDLVLDPFTGSGSVPVAAQQLKRRFIGIEIVPRYAQIARQMTERLPDHRRSLSGRSLRQGGIVQQTDELADRPINPHDQSTGRR